MAIVPKTPDGPHGRRFAAGSADGGKHGWPLAPEPKLAQVIATIEAIERFWHLLYGEPTEAARHAGDEEVYQAYRSRVLALLACPGQPVRYTGLCNDAWAAMPRTLPIGSHLTAIHLGQDRTIDRLAELRAMAIALAYELGEPASGRNGGKRVDDAIGKAHSRRLTALRNAVDHDRPDSDAKRAASSAPTAPKQGKLSFDRYASEYWRLADQYADGGERRRLGQVDFCKHLTAIGIPMEARTLRAQKKAQGWGWPPARPGESAG